MREILFRGKRFCNNEWVEGFLIKDREFYGKPERHSYIVNHQHPSGCFGGDIYLEVYPETVGQYTGLTDKNGKRIFEGDIIKAADTDDPDLVGEIVLNMCSWLVSGSNWSDTLFRANEVHALEVIGNIHDNPELIAEAQDADL